MRRAICAACAVLAFSFGSRAVAAAAPGERVIVVARADDTRAGLLTEELTSLAFEAKSVVAEDAAAPCDPLGIFASAFEAGAVAAMCIDRDAIRIWVGAPPGAVREAIPLHDAGGVARTLVVVQAVEVVRANLRNGLSSPVPLATDTFDRVAVPQGAVPETQAMDVPAEDVPAEPARRGQGGLRAGYRTPRFAVAAGPGFIMSTGPHPVATADLAVTIGVTRWMSIAPRLVIPVTTDPVGTYGARFASARLRPALLGLGVSLPLLRATSLFSAEVGLGGAVVWMHVAPEAADGSFVKTHSEDLLAPAGYANLGASLRLTESLRIGVGGAMGATLARFNVLMGGSSVATWGRPFVDGAVRAQWLLP